MVARSLVTTSRWIAAALLCASSLCAQPDAPHEAATAVPVASALLGQTQHVPLPQPKPGLTWKANVGTVEVSDAALSYRLPQTSFPQVAIVGAYDAENRTPVIHRVLLVGSPTVEIRSEPNVSVTVAVGERTFGPVSTDTKGLTRLKLEAPPGVESVKTFATDAHGNVTEGQLALDPPPFSRTLLLCAPAEEAAYVVEVDETGEFVDTATFEAETIEAVAEKTVPIAPGVFRIPLRIQTPTIDWKRVTVTVRHAGMTDSCSFKVAPPPPSEPFKLSGSVTPIDPEVTLFVGVEAGMSTNFGRVLGPWGALHVSYPFSSIRRGLRVELAVAYTHSQSDVATDDGQGLELTIDSIPVLIGPRYVLAFGLLQVSAAVHGGISFTSQSLVGPLTDQATTATPLWFGGDIGGALLLGGGAVGVNVGYSYAAIDEAEVSGNVAGLRAILRYEHGF